MRVKKVKNKINNTISFKKKLKLDFEYLWVDIE